MFSVEKLGGGRRLASTPLSAMGVAPGMSKISRLAAMVGWGVEDGGWSMVERMGLKCRMRRRF